jgi:hypothetical protein
MGLLGVARANTAVGVSPETFLLKNQNILIYLILDCHSVVGEVIKPCRNDECP